MIKMLRHKSIGEVRLAVLNKYRWLPPIRGHPSDRGRKSGVTCGDNCVPTVEEVLEGPQRTLGIYAHPRVANDG